MRIFHGFFMTILLILAVAGVLASPDAKDAPPASPPPENKCLLCHGNADIWEGEQLRLFISEADLANDIHWQKGLRCWDCHGGNPQADELRAAHAEEDGFRTIKSPADVPKFCGECHANIEYMRRYRPSPRTDQLAEYWTSGHGRRLQATGDPEVATCISCHDKPHGSAQDKTRHGIRPVTELDSPVYRTRVAATCSKCHSDQQLMKGRLYHDQQLPCDEYSKWRQSVHGKAMMEKGDLSAPTCNNCHGNHGAVPPQVDTVANACGVCHGKVARLFEQARMKHKFEEVGLPGCATCHGNHDISRPSDEMLGMANGAVCARCHQNGKYGATLAGSEIARTLRSDLERLQQGIHTAEETLDTAERLGMEVSEPRFELRAAVDEMTNARSQIHTFQLKPVETALAGGAKVVSEVQEKADHVLHEHTARRIWLAATLVPIVLVIVLLVLYIRTLPTSKEDHAISKV
jgi:predicted CXXCH cytochrome family protein